MKTTQIKYLYTTRQPNEAIEITLERLERIVNEFLQEETELEDNWSLKGAPVITMVHFESGYACSDWIITATIEKYE